MQYRALGDTGLQVSIVAMGCWAIAGGGIWGEQDKGEAIAAIEAALDLGINLFDTAQGYGESETLLGTGLGGRRGDAVIATKVSNDQMRPDQIMEACERSLRRLQTDYIDIYQIHWPSREVPLADSLGAMRQLQEQGKIRHIGVCNFGPNDLADLLAAGAPCASNQVVYNLLARAAEFEVQPRCMDAGIGILAYSPLGQGLLTGKFRSPEDVSPGRARSRHFSRARPQTRHGEPGCERETFSAIEEIRCICERSNVPMAEAALAWCLDQPGVTAVLAGARNPAQIKENAAAAERWLEPDVIRQLTAATERLKQALGSSIDIWQSVDRARSR